MISMFEENENLKRWLPDYAKTYLTKTRGGGYVCPLCGSGTGKHGSGALMVDRATNKWLCFSCNKGGDLFDLIGIVENLPLPAEQLKRAQALYGSTQPPEPAHKTAESRTDFTDFYRKAQEHIAETDYLERRGISAETAFRFGLGFEAKWRHPNNPKAPETPRLIIPLNKYAYIARDIRPENTAYRYLNVWSPENSDKFFNAAALSDNEPVFVVEGAIDALSVCEAGGAAVALNSTSNVNALLDKLKAEKPEARLILALDNDEAGRKAEDKLSAGLDELGVRYFRAGIYGSFKDANERLCADRAGLEVAIREAVQAAEATQQAEAQQEADNTKQAEAEENTELEEYIKTVSTASFLQGFINGITENVNTPCIATGFGNLDEALDGGLFEGLFVIGAISSLGKTTFALQIADRIAQSGHDVMFFSLEMSRFELMAKSISRHTLQEALQSGGSTRNAKTCRGITDGKRYAGYSPAENELIHQAIAAYGKYAQNIYIIEGNGRVGTKEIGEAVQKHIRITGRTPVIFIDYLQIIAAYSDRATDKQAIDAAVVELKRLSRDCKTPVVAISSFNRESYRQPVSMAAFKESGAVEYGSDVLLGLQFKGTGSSNFDIDAARRQEPREIQLVVLKNRNGRTGTVLSYSYYPMFNFFREA